MSVPEILARHREEVARIWCEEINARAEMDSNLAESMARFLAERDVLIGRLIEALRAFHDPFRHTPAYARTCATCRLLADPDLAPWRKP